MRKHPRRELRMRSAVTPKTKCGCKGPEWDAATNATVAQFAAVPTNFPRLADINGAVGEGVGGFLLASPSALDRKARILGLRR